MKKPLSLLLLITCFVPLAYGDTPVTANQGKPGNQGPWPVECVSGCSGSGGGGGGSLTTDGGFIGTVLPAPCKTFAQKITDAGTTAVTIPTSGLSTNRIWIDVCNTVLNPSTALCTCSAVSVPSSVALGVIGDTLATGDCQRYPTVFDGGNPWCVCNQASVQLNSSECGS